MKISTPSAKFGLKVASSNFLAITMLAFSSASAFAAQLSIQSTVTLSGTIELPSFNPNFNNRTTRIPTDSQGRYYRNNQLVYQSNQVKRDADGTYYVDFKGIPFVSLDGVLNSPILAGGQLTPYNYQGNPALPGVKFQGVVQDEFVLGRAFYDGILTDPSTGKRYEGEFRISGFSPRYSNPNGGNFPTVFDFKSDIPGSPTITSLSLDNFAVSFNVTVEGEGVEIISEPPSDVTSVPEPATVGGLFLAGIMGLFVKRKSASIARH
ncbi:PEP-CTERM sorting domain-containing protein [Nodularia sp. UHCC 0506]|uniref:PEP-CTERM sorting domain-containing protein n=1 Tax=Nodularia sp. UHCC 0506 TaxID=3110243 RepID=UPI002B1F4C38|nr:PEP-CTERM sorting domain-containing protein [Nodularia sp. UHCC 0506]MEA5512558.1 PEP-CTERM sorting domain-containing protein [Nodularia sp. UHCC 0506]